MALTINKESYEKLIREDIEELNKVMPHSSLERKHIVQVLEWSVNELYNTKL